MATSEGFYFASIVNEALDVVTRKQGNEMITGWDDYFIHQTADPIIVPSVDASNFMDRMFFNFHDSAGTFAIGIGLGQYRNISRMDANSYISTQGTQRFLRLARKTSPDNFAETALGPLRFVIEEPLVRWRATLAPNPMEVSFDFTFLANRPPVSFEQFRFGDVDGIDRSVYSHFVQLGETNGVMTIGGTQYEVENGHALRDRSWGVRRTREKQGLHLWLMHRIGDVDLFLIYNEARDGSVVYCDGAVVDGTGNRRIVSAGHDLHFVDPTLDVDGGKVWVQDERGELHEFFYDRVIPSYTGGVGYGSFSGGEHPDSLIETGDIATSGDTQKILDAQPNLMYDHLCRITYRGDESVGSFQMGITRSPTYKYQPRPLGEKGA